LNVTNHVTEDYQEKTETHAIALNRGFLWGPQSTRGGNWRSVRYKPQSPEQTPKVM